MLRAQLRADGEEAAVEQGAKGILMAARDQDFGSESMHKARNPRNRWRVVMRRPAAHSERARLSPDQVGPSRPAAEGGGTPAQPGLVFQRLGLLPLPSARCVAAQDRVHIRGARPPMRDRLREGSTTTATSRRTLGMKEFSPVEIERIRGLLDGFWIEISLL